MNPSKFLRLYALVCLLVLTPICAFCQTVPSIGKLVGGSKSVPIVGKGGEVVAVYSYQPGDLPGGVCPTNILNGTPLAMISSTTTTATTVKLDVTNPPPYVLTLSQPLVNGTTICVSEDLSPATATPKWSSPQVVTDPGAYGRVRTYFIAGVQVSNQQSATASSTAGQYIEAGFNYTYIRAKDTRDFGYPCPPAPTPCTAQSRTVGPHKGRSPGLSTNLDIRLSPIPVAAPATKTTPSAASTTIQNLLSSQQSVRVVSAVYTPLKLTRWNRHNDYLTIAPLVRAGFATLLNPSVGSSTTATSATQQTTTAQFNTTYYFNGFGTRLAWDRYPVSTDESPQMITQFLLTMGRYSNLPSYVCKPYGPTAAPPFLPATTACDIGPLAGVTTGTGATAISSGYAPSRTLLPRIDIEGLAKLPNYPFVLGLDANLAQYTIPRRGHLDYLNKAGNDIRILIGFQIDLNSVIGKLGVSSQ